MLKPTKTLERMTTADQLIREAHKINTNIEDITNKSSLTTLVTEQSSSMQKSPRVKEHNKTLGLISHDEQHYASTSSPIDKDIEDTYSPLFLQIRNHPDIKDKLDNLSEGYSDTVYSTRMHLEALFGSSLHNDSLLQSIAHVLTRNNKISNHKIKHGIKKFKALSDSVQKDVIDNIIKETKLRIGTDTSQQTEFKYAKEHMDLFTKLLHYTLVTDEATLIREALSSSRRAIPVEILTGEIAVSNPGDLSAKRWRTRALRQVSKQQRIQNRPGKISDFKYAMGEALKYGLIALIFGGALIAGPIHGTMTTHWGDAPSSSHSRKAMNQLDISNEVQEAVHDLKAPLSTSKSDNALQTYYVEHASELSSQEALYIIMNIKNPSIRCSVINNALHGKIVPYEMASQMLRLVKDIDKQATLYSDYLTSSMRHSLEPQEVSALINGINDPRDDSWNGYFTVEARQNVLYDYCRVMLNENVSLDALQSIIMSVNGVDSTRILNHLQAH